jgi:hypothetical protein
MPEQISTQRALDQVADGSSVTDAFLEHILPPQGWCAGAISEAGRFRHIWCESRAQLARRLLQEDAEGRTVYFACGTYLEKGKRRQENSAGACVFWLDVDAGEEAQKKNPKAYKDAIEAYQQVESFRRTVGLRAPTYVGSGRGLHVYWPLVSTLDPQTWKRYAEGLKALCTEYGLHADPARTADIASILRPPGTHHRKGEPKLVECGDLTGPYEIGQFEILLNAAPPSKDQPRTINNDSVAGRLAKVFEHRSVTSNLIANKCKQIACLRDEHGCIPEPRWHASLGVLAYADDGYDRGHEWSSGYPGIATKKRRRQEAA